MKQLLEAGVHFGHQTFKWNPKMRKYIFIKRNGIHIIDLKQTVDAINEAYQYVKEIASNGEYILFVGTKKQAQTAIREASEKSGVFYVNQRWYGGMLTNMQTIRQSIEKMKWYEESTADGSINNYTKLEQLKLKRSHDKIEFSLGGIRDMDAKPGAIFIVDTDHEGIAVHEARVLGIPIIGMVDTNCDPDLIDYVIPANDDATRAIHLIADIMANAVIEGRGIAAEGVSHEAATDTIAEEATVSIPEPVATETATVSIPEPVVEAAPVPIPEPVVAPAPVAEPEAVIPAAEPKTENETPVIPEEN